MPSTFRGRSMDRLRLFGSSNEGSKTSLGTFDADDKPTPRPREGSRRRSSSINRLSAFLLNKTASTPDLLADDPGTSVRGRTPSQRLTKSRPPSLTRSPISDFSSSRSSGHPPSSFRMRPDGRRMSAGSILDTLDPPQPVLIDESVSRSSSPSAGWRPRSRAGSITGPSRPASRLSMTLNNLSDQISSPASPDYPPSDKKAKRKSLFFGGSRNKTKIAEVTGPSAWIAGDDETKAYDLAPLVGAEVVQELWDEEGDTLVYLFPRTSDKGPSFKIRSTVFASSPLLTELAYGGRPQPRRKRVSRPPQLDLGDLGKSSLHTPPHTPKIGASKRSSSEQTPEIPAEEYYVEEVSGQTSLYIPISLSTDGMLGATHEKEPALTVDDVEKLISIRNLFAFLVGGALVATPRRHTFLAVFISVARSLEAFGFTNMDSTTFGEIADVSFRCYVDELDLADVRTNPERLVEAVILGEKMRSTLLYNEAFVHAVGRYAELQQLVKVPAFSTKFSMISRATRIRMERAWIDLQQRVKTANTRLTEFDYPSLFIGSKIKPFRDGFLATRRHILSYYKAKYGAWPPKANFKKNDLTTSGLNRLVLKELYKDFTEMYDLYVDRTSLTTRAMDQVMVDDNVDESDTPLARRMRGIFDEFDRSMPPVQPPVPFDIPLLPNLATIRPDLGTDEKKDAKLRSKKIKDEGVLAVLSASRNSDVVPSLSPFLTSICKFERKEARGKNIQDIVNLRAGIWIFLYVVVQSLPMLVIDAPGVRHHQGVEYFLCQPPRRSVPWAMDAEGGGRFRQSMAWYGIAGGSGMVNLPSDLVEHGVEGIYRRSHCWIMANRWSAEMAMNNQGSPLQGDLIEQEWHDRSSADGLSFSQEPSAYGDFPLPPPPVMRETVDGSPAMMMSSPVDTPLASPIGSLGSSPTNARQSMMMPSKPIGRTRSPMPRGRDDAKRQSVLALGLEELPIPHGHISSSPAGIPRRPMMGSPQVSGLPVVQNTGATFDDIIAGMDTDKKKGKSKKKSATK